MQVGENNGVVIRAGKQVVGVDREANGSYFVGVRLKRLDDTTATHVPQHARRILMTRRQQPAGRLDAHRRKCATYTAPASTD